MSVGQSSDPVGQTSVSEVLSVKCLTAKRSVTEDCSTEAPREKKSNLVLEVFSGLVNIFEFVEILRNFSRHAVHTDFIDIFAGVFRLSELLQGSSVPSLQFISYLSQYERLNCHQSGNRRYHSAETLNIYFTDSILKAMYQKEVTALVLRDLSKAFDSLCHKI
jgi:hypothetical protein